MAPMLFLQLESDLYGEEMWVDLVEWVRPEETFSSKEELIERMKGDVARLKKSSLAREPASRKIPEERERHERFR